MGLSTPSLCPKTRMDAQIAIGYNDPTNTMKKEETPERFIAPTQRPEEQPLESSLRPQLLEEFIGQESVKDNLRIAIAAAKKRNQPLEHVLIYGNPGLGKTTLAHIIAHELDTHIKVTSGPALERTGDLAAIVSNLQEGDVLFIDEIHRLHHTIEEMLYPAMEDFALDLILGKGPGARTLRMPLAPFTIIGATTKVSMLSAPLRDRFGMIYQLDFYGTDDLQKIINRNASRLHVTMEPDACELIAQRARRTPRIANRLLKRIRDFAEVKGSGIITSTITQQALTMLEVDHLGLDRTDRLLLETLIKKFNGGPVGLNTLAASTAEEMDTIESVYEPYLLQMGMIDRTPRGRVATRHAYDHLGLLHLAPKNNETLFP